MRSEVLKGAPEFVCHFCHTTVTRYRGKKRLRGKELADARQQKMYWGKRAKWCQGLRWELIFECDCGACGFHPTV